MRSRFPPRAGQNLDRSVSWGHFAMFARCAMWAYKAGSLKMRRILNATTVAIATLFLAWPVGAAEPRPSPEARVHFKAGVAALKRAQWDEAYREFKKAYAITPRWTILGNLGIAAQHLERDGEAMQAMDEYLQRGKGDISATETAEVRDAIEALRAGVAEVTLEVPGAFSIVDTRAESNLVNEYGPFENRVTLLVRAGEHTFRVDGASVDVPSWTVALLAGDAATHGFVAESEPPPSIQQPLEPAPPAARHDGEAVAPSHTAPYVLWSVGAGGAVAATVLGLHAHRLQQDADGDFQQRCPLGATGLNGCDNITEGSEQAARWRTVALLTGVGTLGVLVTGTVLYLGGDSTNSRGVANAAAPKLWVGASSIGFAGVF